MSHAAAVEALLFAALEKVTDAERNAFLDSACAGDAELRRQVERLLKAEARAGDFLQKPVLDQLAAPQPSHETNRTTDHVPAAGSTDESHPAADAPGGGLPALPGYRVLREIARGGMGRVLAARDLTLDRDIALKVLLPGANPDRFVRESRISARLAHPGIPPVHALGMLADGSPFLAMKLIAGQTLAVEIKTADRPRLLQVFTQVCQAVGFAHSKGVVHRDLKPANVMVGGFGEVQVMDWGLAKDLTSPDNRDESGSSTAPAQAADPQAAAKSTNDQTQAGTILGTPAYMAPEQARGEACDARSDVFALGGLLCAILTGKGPYSSKSSVELIRQARAADLAEAHARLDGCGADAELVELCRRCLSANPVDRPADGQAVADGLTAYLNGVQERLQTARRERAVAIAREAEQRKRRKVQRALAAAVVALLLGGGAFVWWRNAQINAQVQDRHERDARSDEAVATHLDQGEEGLRADDAARAQIALEGARKRSAEGGAEKQGERLGRLAADLALLRALNEVDKHQWTWATNGFPDPAETVPTTREALGQFGADPDATSVDEAAARVSASAVRERITIALDRLLLHQNTAGVRALLRRVDADPYRDAVRDAVLARDPAKLADLANQGAALEQPAGFAAFLGELGVIPVGRRRQLLQAAVSRRPRNLHPLMTLIQVAEKEKDGVDEQLRWRQAAVAAAPDNFAACMNLGAVLCDDKRDYDGAIPCFEKATELDPNSASAHYNLGNARAKKGKVDEAISCFEKALALDPNKMDARNALGDALKKKGRLEDALACFEKALALDPKDLGALNGLGTMLAARCRWEESIAYFNKAVEISPKDARLLVNLGLSLSGKGEVDQAIACCEKAVALDPKLALAHLALGTVRQQKGQLDEAITCFRKAIALDQQFAGAYVNLGSALSEKGEWNEAIACFRKAVELDPKNAAVRCDLGISFRRKGQLNEAIACFHKAIELDPKNAEARCELGMTFRRKGQLDEAIAWFRKAIELDPQFARAYINLGGALIDRGEWNEAIACLRKAVELDPMYAEAHFSLGIAYQRRNQLDEAVASYRKAVELDPRNAEARCELGSVLRDKGDPDAAIDQYHKAIGLDPNYAKSYANLGVALRDKGDLDGAFENLRKALTINPGHARTLGILGLVQKDKGDLDGAIVSTRKAVEIAPKDAWTHDTLGDVLMVKGELDEAADQFNTAIRLDPNYAKARENLTKTKRIAAVQGKLPALLKGDYQPRAIDERLALADLCTLRRLYRASAGLYADAFTADPRTAADLKAAHLYNAASSAALAGTGQGQDAAGFDGKEKARLRQQSLDWLRADLVLRTRQLESGRPADRAEVQQKLNHWRNDRDLAGVRDKDALAKLPAEERVAWEKLWADMAALVKTADTPAPKSDRP
jgi:tetratricopeptide (TPR) repeat protein